MAFDGTLMQFTGTIPNSSHERDLGPGLVYERRLSVFTQRFGVPANWSYNHFCTCRGCYGGIDFPGPFYTFCGKSVSKRRIDRCASSGSSLLREPNVLLSRDFGFCAPRGHVGFRDTLKLYRGGILFLEQQAINVWAEYGQTQRGNKSYTPGYDVWASSGTNMRVLRIENQRSPSPPIPTPLRSAFKREFTLSKRVRFDNVPVFYYYHQNTCETNSYASMVADQMRFRRRIKEAQYIISPVLRIVP
ncbi:putative ubiquitin fold modifier conjugating enzyme motif protein [Ranid herpesvirus 3]|uniref:Putative ubiquitin fold modifier conjugating enzyme motif protein n=1 Tax=Ranid herpesvirus 3 TaxID=1987509 RepID=A0A1X9T557_9VIRU|nr:putative ubiquitin fold modifier conjugating enzyme motif protein [Ranid herpesvirus 3]ARR28834.1 putative ubiquitin fold modifier conjugating enzyme motif protein [Ranid herpesvirus 3]